MSFSVSLAHRSMTQSALQAQLYQELGYISRPLARQALGSTSFRARCPSRMTTVTALVSKLMSIARGHIEPCTVAANSIREAVDDLIVRAMGWSHFTVDDRAYVLLYFFDDSQQHSDRSTMAE